MKKVKKFSGGGHMIGEVGKGGQRLSKANWNTWEPAEEKEETKSKNLTPSDSFDEDVESEGVARERRRAAREADTQHRTYATMNADGEEDGPPPEAKPLTFKQAFALHKGEKKPFMWNGSWYSTDVDTGEKPSVARPRDNMPMRESPTTGMTNMPMRESPTTGMTNMPRRMSGTEKYAAGADQKPAKWQPFEGTEKQRKLNAEAKARAEARARAKKLLEDEEQAERDEAVKSGSLKSSFSKPYDVAEMMRQNQMKAQGFKKGGKIKKYSGTSKEGSVVTGSKSSKNLTPKQIAALKEAKANEDRLVATLNSRPAPRPVPRPAPPMGLTRAAIEGSQNEANAMPPGGMKKGGNVKKNWIASAIKKPGALRESLGVKKGEKIPAKKLAAAAKKPGKMGQRARLAQTLKGFKEGGHVRGGGCESRGKTRGKYV